LNLDTLRDPVHRIIDPTVRWMVRRGVHPNLVTTLGFLCVTGSGYLYHLDHVRWAGLLVLIGGMWDIFDGQVARVSGMASKFGSFYDSTLDRISEIVVFLGLLSLYNSYGRALADVWMVYVIFAAMGGSLMVSYTRARAEGLGLDCKVGLMQRPERVVLLGLGSLAFGLDFDGVVLMSVIVVVAVLTNLTAIQRIWWVYRHAAGVPVDDPSLRGQ
jgi:CDP-diacylglycerol--glycerol-3-phosphate 3-phosphatidyltransferase